MRMDHFFVDDLHGASGSPHSPSSPKQKYQSLIRGKKLHDSPKIQNVYLKDETITIKKNYEKISIMLQNKKL